MSDTVPNTSGTGEWLENDFRYNTLPEVIITPKKLMPSQVGDSGFLSKVGDIAGKFLGKLKLPSITVDHNIGTVEGGTKKTMMMVIGGIILLALVIKKK